MAPSSQALCVKSMHPLHWGGGRGTNSDDNQKGLERSQVAWGLHSDTWEAAQSGFGGAIMGGSVEELVSEASTNSWVPFYVRQVCPWSPEQCSRGGDVLPFTLRAIFPPRGILRHGSRQGLPCDPWQHGIAVRGTGSGVQVETLQLMNYESLASA